MKSSSDLRLGAMLDVFARIVTATGDPAFKCYAASEALYHALGGKKAGIVPQVMRLPAETQVRITDNFVPWPELARVLAGEATHWYLKIGDNILDPTVGQFVATPTYNGKGCGFLTKRPSRAARAILRRAEIHVP